MLFRSIIQSFTFISRFTLIYSAFLLLNWGKTGGAQLKREIYSNFSRCLEDLLFRFDISVSSGFPFFFFPPGKRRVVRCPQSAISFVLFVDH